MVAAASIGCECGTVKGSSSPFPIMTSLSAKIVLFFSGVTHFVE